jgi:hypothetical protein
MQHILSNLKKIAAEGHQEQKTEEKVLQITDVNQMTKAAKNSTDYIVYLNCEYFSLNLTHRSLYQFSFQSHML